MTKLFAAVLAAIFAVCVSAAVIDSNASAQSNKGNYCGKHWKPGCP